MTAKKVPAVNKEAKTEVKKAKRSDPNVFEPTHNELESYFMSPHVTAVREFKGASAASKSKLFRITMALQESVGAKAYQEAKKDLFERIGELPIDPDTGEEIEGGQKQIPPGNEEFSELLEQSSGIKLTKPHLAMTDFSGCSEVDYARTAWVFNWVETSKDVKEAEGNNGKGKNKKKGKGR